MEGDTAPPSSRQATIVSYETRVRFQYMRVSPYRFVFTLFRGCERPLWLGYIRVWPVGLRCNLFPAPCVREQGIKWDQIRVGPCRRGPHHLYIICIKSSPPNLANMYLRQEYIATGVNVTFSEKKKKKTRYVCSLCHIYARTKIRKKKKKLVQAAKRRGLSTGRSL